MTQKRKGIEVSTSTYQNKQEKTMFRRFSLWDMRVENIVNIQMAASFSVI